MQKKKRKNLSEQLKENYIKYPAFKEVAKLYIKGSPSLVEKPKRYGLIEALYSFIEHLEEIKKYTCIKCIKKVDIEDGGTVTIICDRCDTTQSLLEGLEELKKWQRGELTFRTVREKL